MHHFLESTLACLDPFLFDHCRTFDLFGTVLVLVCAASHHILLHFELQTTVISEFALIFPGVVAGHHQRGLTFNTESSILFLFELALLGLYRTASDVVELCEHRVLREELMIECLCGSDPLLRILLEEPLQ